MVLREVAIEYKGTFHTVDYDTDDGEEVLKYQLYSLTDVLPENQKIMGISQLASSAGLHTLTLVEKKEDTRISAPQSTADIAADEQLARALQAEEDASSMQQQREQGRQAFEKKLESYRRQVMLYEDPTRQNAARSSVPLDELEEKAVVALAKEGKRNAGIAEQKYALLLQLLFWFKSSFKWVNDPACDGCGAKTDRFDMGSPTLEELRFGANRVEQSRCRACGRTVRFPRYNDPLKLLETRSGRCGEWANCFTLYCRALGYQARLVLDFTDHVWTECFSDQHRRWVHLDPCEGAYDKPLLYEEGWNKQLSYVIALASDGVYDVTKRYTRKWQQVLLRRNAASEAVVQEVVTGLTGRARAFKSTEEIEVLMQRDRQEVEEITAASETQFNQALLPGRQSGSQEWRLLRGETGSSHNITSTELQGCPSRPCVDEHVTQIGLALGCLLQVAEAGQRLKQWQGVLEQLKSQPFKRRQVILGKDAWLQDKLGQPLFEALGLRLAVQENGQVCIGLDGDPITTALGIPVVLEKLEDLTKEFEKSRGSSVQVKWLIHGRRLGNGVACASGEQLPFGIASAAFDGLHSTKWEEPNGASGGWIEYRLAKDTMVEQLAGYEVTSANDCPERDPLNWVLEGSDDGGQTWMCLDTQQGQIFEDRFMKKTYEIAADKLCTCTSFRFRCLSVRDSTSQSRLQIAGILLYATRGS